MIDKPAYAHVLTVQSAARSVRLICQYLLARRAGIHASERQETTQ
ncbi:Uncharacterised protein [Mycobacteroides abscessus subsp. bolletii]|nr:Uncharacterised protein [Mycobacteroides abscessus subsp. bolletii]SKG58508.1 Uncharacterised protein [Mycobacteroides abscessus subsp. bolletii]SKG81351.1 Uncharacterised protein [Mycobacteroides abscessus subsp. bolletii]SKG95924.1 Uncharacterised protein [Mycobacteroides abscessus subsp. bolletii]SKH24400.1 Uncharacterised protein [Mycobacteroides abscessus subsp. bolletii]